MPPHPFHFWGFTPRSKGERVEHFKTLKIISGTHIFYESPHRIFESINSFFEVHPNSELVVAKELTKTFQSVIHLDKKNIHDVENLIIDKGEFVLLYHQAEVSMSFSSDELISLVDDYLSSGGGVKKLSKIFSKITGEESKNIYDKLSRSK